MSLTAAPTDVPPRIESHGIDLIPASERRGVPRDLFGMWAGVNLNVFYVVNGAVIISLGLSLWQAALAILIGNLAFFAVGLTSLQGPKTGTSTFAVSRASFGPKGGVRLHSSTGLPVSALRRRASPSWYSPFSRLWRRSEFPLPPE